MDYRQRIKSDFCSNNMRQVWSGIQNITNHRLNAAVVDSDPKLAEDLNLFFFRFQVDPP